MKLSRKMMMMTAFGAVGTVASVSPVVMQASAETPAKQSSGPGTGFDEAKDIKDSNSSTNDTNNGGSTKMSDAGNTDGSTSSIKQNTHKSHPHKNTGQTKHTANNHQRHSAVAGKTTKSQNVTNSKPRTHVQKGTKSPYQSTNKKLTQTGAGDYGMTDPRSGSGKAIMLGTIAVSGVAVSGIAKQHKLSKNNMFTK